MPPDERPEPDRSPKSLEARLRGLPQPTIPAGLESKLLAVIPAGISIRRRRWVMWAGVLGPLAAAALLVVFNWPRNTGNSALRRSSAGQSRGQGSISSAGINDAAPNVPVQVAHESAMFAEWREVRRILSGAEPASFTWPLEESSPVTVTTALPAYLLD
jgi:hypothetical protein